jgi:PAS domain S-box-containing protein
MLQIPFDILATVRFIPHGHCYLWQPSLVWFHLLSDLLIAIAYYSIPVTLLYFVSKRADLPYPRIFFLFAAFIVCCGTTHLMEIWTLWHPTYWVSGLVKAITAVVSINTAWEIIPLIPKALALPSIAQLEQEIINYTQTEQALRESEERFRSAFNYAVIGKALVASDGRWLKVNPSLCKIIGYSESELLGLIDRDITHPEDLDLDLGYVNQMLKGEIRTYQIEKRYLHKQGYVVWGLLSVSLVRDEKDQPLYFIAQIQDITTRKQAETALKQSEQRYRGIVEDQTELIARFDRNGKLIFVNDAYCRYFGIKKEEIIGKSYQPLVYPKDQSKIDELLNSLNYKNPVGKVENRVIVNGEIRWMQWINRMIFDEEGNLVDFQSVGQDIGDRKQVEEALQKRESILRSFYDGVPMMMGIVQLIHEKISHISYNNTAADFFGLPPETSNDCSVNQIVIFQQIMREWIQSYQKSEPTSHSTSFEYVYHTDTNPIYLSVTISLIKELSSDDLWFSYVVEDITEQKQATAIKQKEILIKELHHRVKNNLQIICSLLNLQSRLVKDSTVVEKFKEIKNRIITISLVHEQLYQSENISQINLSEYITALANNLFRCYALESQNVSLKVETKHNFFLDLDTVIPCGLIINELISNALKYAFLPGLRAKIEIEITVNQEKNLILIIKDNGKGLPDNLIIEKSQTLGLKLVKNLINQLRGRLQINQDEGTSFIITLTKIKNKNLKRESNCYLKCQKPF